MLRNELDTMTLVTPDVAPTSAPLASDRPSTWSERHYWMGVAVITLAGLGFRVGYVLLFTRNEKEPLNDAFWYGMQSLQMSMGHFFEVWFSAPAPDAAHPPLTSIVLTPASYFFGLNTGATPQKMTMAIVGALTVLVVAMLGRAVAGPRVGLVAGVLAAFYPNFWLPSGIMMSEALTMLLTALILLWLYRLLRAPTWGNAALVGLACGLLALTRAELALFVPFLLVPAALLTKGPTLRRRIGLAAVGTAVAVITVMPWVGRNLASFQDATFLSTGGGNVISGANCPATYYGPILGGWSLGCTLQAGKGVKGDQSVVSAHEQHVGTQYLEHHLSRVPIVVAARIGRLWDVYQPINSAEDTNEGRPANASIAGMAVYFLLLPAAAWGIVELRRRHLIQWPLLVPAGVLTIVAAAAYGLVRFRSPFEICLVVLAAAGIDGVLRITARRRARRPVAPAH